MALPLILTADAIGLFAFFGQPEWGIFASGSGAPLLLADSVYSVEYSRDYQISDFPQEAGAFASYNKVQVPFQAKVSFLANRLRYNFFATVEQATASLDLVTVVMPEFTYPNANITHYGFRRTARNGKTLVMFEVWCEEVRILASSKLSGSNTGTKASDIGTAAGGEGAAGAAGEQGGTGGTGGVPGNGTGPSAATGSPGQFNGLIGENTDQTSPGSDLGTQSSNGAAPQSSGQVQPTPTQPTQQGGFSGQIGENTDQTSAGPPTPVIIPPDANTPVGSGGAEPDGADISFSAPGVPNGPTTPPAVSGAAGTSGIPKVIGSMDEIQ